MKVRKTAAVAAPLVAAIVFVTSSLAQPNAWPQQPVKIVVGLAAGGLTDTITRIIAQPLGEQLGQPMVVENRPGAAGTIAAEVVARGPADGYTLVMGNLPQMVILPAMQTTKYDPLKDFAPISLVGSNPFVLCVNPKLPVHTLAEFIAYVKARPGQLAFGSGGIGNGTHLSMAYFLKLAGLDMIHVPYKGGAPAMADLVAGHVVANFSSSSDALPQVRAGTVRAIAVSSGTRWPKLPDVPTVSELGYPTFKTITWNGLMAPAKTPKEIVSRVAAEVARAVKEPAVIEHMGNQGIDPIGSTPEEFAAAIKDDVALWTEAVNAAGVKGQ
ncbi:Bug family tripartite tricarboxylate transporter substrate binding protein [Rhodoplanes sp. Z2-YC6860]|uniref:Bug family tripartite tricarboxylate transporter substrate binding protein n=1 Tax=Rhodoplanes sp. Z2-YC6860 TaxID=674703 RepID=UPI00078D1DC2|nr:tripartite tricarboxylate transporter substrate binding protein [Rhodoplanes sp. Z2-YC6860]AMN41860.1 TTT family tricarboxylate transporter, receptor protein [Rhodoplanes sp. Z2-YC6860]